MKVITPEISWHGKEPVYSVDFQPGKRAIQRLASASVDKLVRIWQINVDSEGKLCVDFLSNLRRHTRSVNVCRFSPDGEILASAGDDNVILFWRLSNTPTPPNNIFNEEDSDNKETWVTSSTLRGHLEDVYDLSWSADGRYLVSGSVDNSAILWDTMKETKLALFNDHKSFVQGVALDPLNEFVATLSTDRSCRVFSIANKNCIHNVSKMMLPTPESDVKPKAFRMFHDDTLGSFFRRLSFSPDGQFLIVPAGCVEQGDKVTSATFVFTRNCLSKPALYLPSPQKPTVAVKVCPRLYELRKNPNKDLADKENNNCNEWEKYSTLFCLPYRVIFAVATEDAVLLYDTQQSKPFAYVGNTHYLQMTDITWSSDGQLIVVSSTDGFCTLISFDDDELGTVYTPPEKSTANETVADQKTSLSTPKREKSSTNETVADQKTSLSTPKREKSSTNEAVAEQKVSLSASKQESAVAAKQQETKLESDDDLVLVLDDSTSGSASVHASKEGSAETKVVQVHASGSSEKSKTKVTSPCVVHPNLSVKSVTPALSVKSIVNTPNKPKRIAFQTLSLHKPS